MSAPRIFYDSAFDDGALRTAVGSTLQVAGATNLLTYSDDLRNTTEAGSSRPWSQFVNADTDVALQSDTLPDGTTGNASKLRCTTSGYAQRQTGQAFTAADNTVYCISAYAKAAEVTRLSLMCQTKTPSFPHVVFNLSTGVVQANVSIGGESPVASGIINAGGGWYRCWAAFDVKTGATAVHAIPNLRAASTDYYNGAINDGLLLWGLQTELGGAPTPLLRTTTAAVTRTPANAHVFGAGQTGASLITRGWAASQTGVLLTGDQITLAGRATVYTLTANANTDIYGRTTLALTPSITSAPADLSAIQIVRQATADNVRDWRPYTWWRPLSLPAALTVDCASPRACDYALVWGHDLATHGATVEVRGSTDNFVASNVLVATSTPGTNAPVLLQFNAVSYRYWRLRVTGTTLPSIAIAAIGSRLELPGFLGTDYDPTRRRVIGQTNRNNNGQPLGKIIDYTEQTNRVTLRRVTWQWVRNTFLPAWRAHLRATPFVFAWDSVIDPTNLPLVTAGDDLSTPHYPGQQADVSFDITAAVD